MDIKSYVMQGCCVTLQAAEIHHLHVTLHNKKAENCCVTYSMCVISFVVRRQAMQRDSGLLDSRRVRLIEQLKLLKSNAGSSGMQTIRTSKGQL